MMSIRSIWFFWIAFLLFGSSVCAKEISLKDIGLTFDVPDEFAPLPQVVIDSKWQKDGAPSWATGNQGGASNIAYNLLDIDLSDVTLDDLKEQFTEVFNQQIPGIEWVEKKIVTLDSRQWLNLEMLSEAVDTDIHNIMLITLLDNQVLMLNFNSTRGQFTQYEDAYRKSIESIRLADVLAAPFGDGTVADGETNKASDAQPAVAGSVVNPLAPTPVLSTRNTDIFLGTFKSEELSIVVSALESGYKGVLTLSGVEYPMTAAKADGKLYGVFISGDQEYEFTLVSLNDDDRIRLSSGGADYDLVREYPPETKNPLRKLTAASSKTNEQEVQPSIRNASRNKAAAEAVQLKEGDTVKGPATVTLPESDFPLSGAIPLNIETGWTGEYSDGVLFLSDESSSFILLEPIMQTRESVAEVLSSPVDLGNNTTFTPMTEPEDRNGSVIVAGLYEPEGEDALMAGWRFLPLKSDQGISFLYAGYSPPAQTVDKLVSLLSGETTAVVSTENVAQNKNTSVGVPMAEPMSQAEADQQCETAVEPFSERFQQSNNNASTGNEVAFDSLWSSRESVNGVYDFTLEPGQTLIFNKAIYDLSGHKLQIAASRFVLNGDVEFVSYIDNRGQMNMPDAELSTPASSLGRAFNDRKGKDGEDGDRGPSGYPGNAGSDVVMYAKKVSGRGSLTINAVGQHGGAGGAGQRGQRGQGGGNGQNGRDTYDTCRDLPMPGRQGGDGGDGGVGGTGGIGGASGNVCLAESLKTYASVSVDGGNGGEPGASGEGGLPGDYGRNGRGSLNCFAATSRYTGTSNRGSDADPLLAQRGQAGASGTVSYK